MRAEFTKLANGRAQRSGNRLRGSLAGGLPRRTPRARRGREKVVVGNWMVTTDVVLDFAVRRGWGMALVDVPANHANITNHESLDPGVFGARRFKHEDRRGRSLGAGTSYWCGDDD